MATTKVDISKTAYTAAYTAGGSASDTKKTIVLPRPVLFETPDNLFPGRRAALEFVVKTGNAPTVPTNKEAPSAAGVVLSGDINRESMTVTVAANEKIFVRVLTPGVSAATVIIVD